MSSQHRTYMITKMVNGTTESDLIDLAESLPKDTRTKLLNALSIAEENDREVYFNMKDYLNEWKTNFEQAYSSLDQELVEERLMECKNSLDYDLKLEYLYLSRWYQEQSKFGGLFNFF